MMTKNALSRSPLLLLLTLGGCMGATGEGEYTKAEAREMSGSTDDGADICALMGWYGDEVCDGFCVEPDPDCAECAALIACEPGETPHRDASECPADASCREVTGCGVTVWCSGAADCSAGVSCAEGETMHASASDCPQDVSCVEVTHCGETFWCASYEAATCPGENPQGCASSGCEAGFHCDTTIGDRPSACACSPETGTWTCSADLNGGECVPD